ncbi:uncharacterized protein LOC136072183 [Hydra vulgaris]|uniref:uncharacterized protein LOC136072183 n=1 Tax=Hydra vulgaris TaxID=6087 RepID=UPI000640E4F4
MNKRCKGGRKLIKLSPNVKTAMINGKLSRSFWTRFHAKHSFSSDGITSQMTPQVAVEKISHLLVTTSENGISDNDTFKAACQEFDDYLTEKAIERPVVLLSDGHSSRFTYDGLIYLLSKQIWLFISPPDTTDVTQLLDQVNKNLHHEYRIAKNYLFNPMPSINREGFMTILGNIYGRNGDRNRFLFLVQKELE